MEDVNEGSVPSIFLIQLLVLKMIQYSSLLIPISLFFGIIVALTRFNVSNEMVIMKGGGYSSYQVSKVLSKLIMIISTVVMLFNFFITPIALDHRLQLQHQIIYEQKIYSLKEKNFSTSNDKSKVVYINNKSTSEPANIFIKTKGINSFRVDIAAGMQTSESNDNLVILNNGSSYVFNNDGSLSATQYVNQDILLLNELPLLINNDIESKSIIDLYNNGDELSLREGLKRLSMIIATIILGYLAIPISQVSHGDDKYRNIFLSTVFYFSYILFINFISKAFDTINLLLLSFFILHLIYLLITYRFYLKSENINQ
tara:strand:- start:7778 stop:8719 length:942 start_codon:yes stop_codon:yes gene_type:complete